MYSNMEDKARDGDVSLDRRMLLTVKELQALTGIGRNNCFKLIRDANCSFRVGRKILVDREAFQKWYRQYML